MQFLDEMIIDEIMMEGFMIFMILFFTPLINGLPVRQPSPDVGFGIFWLNE